MKNVSAQPRHAELKTLQQYPEGNGRKNLRCAIYTESLVLPVWICRSIRRHEKGPQQNVCSLSLYKLSQPYLVFQWKQPLCTALVAVPVLCSALPRKVNCCLSCFLGQSVHSRDPRLCCHLNMWRSPCL